LLNVRNRSSQEMSERLRAEGFAAEIISETIERLQGVGLLDDERFARERASALGRGKGWGPRKLRWDLGRHRLSAEIIEQAIAQAYGKGDVTKFMRELVVRRFGPEVVGGRAEPRQAARARRFLLQRGFDPDQVGELFESY